jgi:hypothetical protein
VRLVGGACSVGIGLSVTGRLFMVAAGFFDGASCFEGCCFWTTAAHDMAGFCASDGMLGGEDIAPFYISVSVV